MWRRFAAKKAPEAGSAYREPREAAGADTQEVIENRTMMDRNMVGRQLDNLPSGDSIEIACGRLERGHPPEATSP